MSRKATDKTATPMSSNFLERYYASGPLGRATLLQGLLDVVSDDQLAKILRQVKEDACEHNYKPRKILGNGCGNDYELDYENYECTKCGKK